MFNELKDAYELEPEWEEIQRDAHLGIARSDGGVDLGNIDPRVIEVLNKHNPSYHLKLSHRLVCRSAVRQHKRLAALTFGVTAS